MARGFPSMTALLGLLAVAGYQNRDKLAEMLGGLGQGQSGAPGQDNQVNRQGGTGGLHGGLDGLLGGLSGAGIGGLLGGGLRDLVDSFKQAGQGEAVESWVGRGPNKQIAPQHLEQAIGPDVLATLSRETGLSHEELLSRLTRNLPEAIDKYTPEGRIPNEHELARS
jgi:uncharacterized protein YidB (DUF937 family)